MARADGTIYINTNINTQGFNSGIGQIRNSVGGLRTAFTRLGVAIGSTFAIKELVRFGKEAIDLGSDLQEVQNVVDVTFTILSDEVDNFARAAAKTAGLSETMAKRYAGTFGSMAKAFGFAEENAFDMATALTQLSGDIASFYNITQDEAYTKLKSIFTGETESLKDLGVVMTQTALDSFAMQKGIGKVTSQMSEQEKVALRYQFVLEQLSLASGDFQRTSDGWANQMRIMSLNIESLKANIGQGLINLFAPLAKIINTLIEKLGILAEKFKAFTEVVTGQSIEKTNKATSELANNFSSSSKGVDDFTDSLKKANKEAKKTLSPLDNLNNITTKISDGLSEENLSLDSLLNTSDSTKNVSVDVEGVDDLSKLDLALSALSSGFEKFGQILQKIWIKVKPVFVELKKEIQYFASVFINWFKEKIMPVLERLKDGFFELYENTLKPLFKEVSEALSDVWQNTLKPLFEWIFEKIGVILPPIIEGIGNAFFNAWEEIREVASFVIDEFNGIIKFITGVFEKDWEKAWEGIVDTFKGIINALISTFEGFINFVIDGLNGIINGANALSGSIGVDFVIPNIPKFEIPKLATGAVIPPNAPFVAMLGDQKHGTNIEAPLDTIKQGLSEVLSEMGINVTFEVEGDEAGIFRVTQRQAKMFTKQTGKPAY